MALVCLFISSLFSGIHPLQLKDLSAHAKFMEGTTATLSCTLDSADSILNSLKWFKNNVELCKYEPRRSGGFGQAFEVSQNFKFQEIECGNTSLKLGPMSMADSGSYACEVSAFLQPEGTIQTVTGSRNLSVFGLAMSAVLAENYQLKWHSHNAHLHSSVATLYRSDNFTDVTLVTSDGRYLAAHRFVLSSCSSYLNRVLHLGAVNGAHFSSTPLVVVLPPEISYRTMAILLQYMYSGEATVSNDQLNGVLRAGELLRIKGLCHAGNKEKEKKYFSSNVSTHSDTHSRAGSSNSGRLSANNYYQASQSQAHNKTAESCNPSSSTAAQSVKNPKTLPIEEASIETQGTSCSNVKEKKSNRENKEKENGNNLEVSSSGEGSEIIVEDNMKIELLVKEEPIDWDDDDDLGQDDRGESVGSVKTERLSPGGCSESMYAPLTCDMCQQTFTSPALWVRHIETHPVTDIPPKKRKRPQGEDDNDEEEEFQLLRCELCQKMYTSPADWVRHIQSSHTEEQLAVTNSNRRLRKSTLVSCPSCSKTFPSLASMLIHSRTHTGEKPYVCCVCEKGFNVKSNLLRHLRTLHDHLLSPDTQYQTVLKDAT